MRRLLIVAVVLAAACSDALEHDTTAGQVIAVVERSPSTVVRLISAEDFSVRQLIPLSYLPMGRPAARGNLVLLFTGHSVVVLDLGGTPAPSERIIEVSTALGFGRALAFQDDSIAWAALDLNEFTNPQGYRLARINVRTGDTTTRSLPAVPRSVGVANGSVFVLLAAPDETSWLSVVDPATLQVVDSVGLTPLGGLAVTVGTDGFLYVIAGGAFTTTAADGRLAIVDPASRAEVAVINGLGDPTGPAVEHPSGRLLVPSVQGILEVNTLTRSVTRGPADGVKPAGDLSIGLVLDERGRVYSIQSHCPDPDATSGFVYVLSPPPDYTLLRTIAVGTCPLGAAVAVTP